MRVRYLVIIYILSQVITYGTLKTGIYVVLCNMNDSNLRLRE